MQSPFFTCFAIANPDGDLLGGLSPIGLAKHEPTWHNPELCNGTIITTATPVEAEDLVAQVKANYGIDLAPWTLVTLHGYLG